MVVLTDAALLSSVLNQAGQRLMGMNVPADGHHLFVEQFHEAERAAQLGAGEVVWPDPVGRAESFVLSTYPRDVYEWRMLQANKTLEKLLRGE